MRWVHPILEQKAPHRVCPALRKVQIGGIRADTIGIAFDHCPALRILLKKGHQGIQILQGARAKLGFAGLKQDITQGEYQASLRLFGLEGRQFLLELLNLARGCLRLTGGHLGLLLRPLRFAGPRVKEHLITVFRALLDLRFGHLLLCRRSGNVDPLCGQGGKPRLLIDQSGFTKRVRGLVCDSCKKEISKLEKYGKAHVKEISKSTNPHIAFKGNYILSQ